MSGHELALIVYGAVSALYLRRELAALKSGRRMAPRDRAPVTRDDRRKVH